jgi:hypothetical protein
MQRTSPGPRGARRAAAAAASRAEQIARIYTEHADELHAYVTSITRTDPQTIEDACSHAWTQLLSHPAIDLEAARSGTLRWLTTTAAREAWRLHKLRVAPAHAAALCWASPDDGARDALLGVTIAGR